MIPGMKPDLIAKKMLLGDFGKALCVWLNKHQKGNKLLMETLVPSRPYQLTAFTPEGLYERVKGKEDASGLMFIFEAVEHQQHDIIRALQAAIKAGAEAQRQASIHGQVGKKVEVHDEGREPQAAPPQADAGSTPAAQSKAPSDDAAHSAEPAAPDRDSAVAEMRERQRLEDLEQQRELTR